MEKANDIVAGKDRLTPEQYLPSSLLKQPPSAKSFSTYLYGENKVYSLLILFLVVVQFSIFKLLYPFPDFFSDSYSYIFAAYAHLDVNIWPIGYSKFLMMFHALTHSAIALNFFQYIFLEVAALYFYHTLVYYYPTGKNTRTVLCLFLFFNPLNLYLANYVTSDSIFIGLSLIWLSQLIWIIHRPRPYQIFVQALLFIIAFTFRYNAMYYPILAGAAFFMSRQKLPWKVAGSLLGPLLMIWFILFSREATLKMTGTAQFPPILGGWQWGNNALYIRNYITEDSTKFPTKETAELDQIARNYFRITPPQYRDLVAEVANFFIRHPEAPLKQYYSTHYQTKTIKADVIAWGKCAPIFGQYGLYLIKRHPLAFVRYFLLVNTKNYLLPPLEKLEIYNLGQDEMWPIGAFWFDFYSPKVKSVSKTLQGNLLLPYPGIFLILNFYFLWSLYLFIRRKAYKIADHYFNFTILLISGFVFLNAGFSIFANIIVIRYQVFPMILFLAFSMLLTDSLDLQLAKGKSLANTNESASEGPSLPFQTQLS
jgi:hypothetical protein